MSVFGYICTFLPLPESQAKDAEGGTSWLGNRATSLGPICPASDLVQSQVLKPWLKRSTWSQIVFPLPNPLSDMMYRAEESPLKS